MATTDIPAIRAQLITVIEALTPTRMAEIPFRRSIRRDPIAEVADRNSAHFRKFEISQPGSGEEDQYINSTQIQRREPVSITVAYPLLSGFAGPDELDDLRDMMREDRRTLRDAIFDPDNYLSGVNLFTPPVAEYIEDGAEVWFLVLTTDVVYNEPQTF